MDPTYRLDGGAQPTTKRRVDLDGPDFYPTPRWATYALIDNEKFIGNIWEPACGDGSMSEVLKEVGIPVISSDLYDRGYGETGVDFLTSTMRARNIITNPPLHSAEAFFAKAFELVSNGKIALLLRLAFLEGAHRAQEIFRFNPPCRVWVFSERITFYPRGVKTAGGGTVAYAWFVWDKYHGGPTELKWFRPGYKKQYGN